jgi:hypothetical protein
MKSIYLILDKVDRIPILTADSFEKAKLLLDDYMGLGLDKSVKYIGFDKYEPEYYEIYQGVFKYTSSYGSDEFILYCMELNQNKY